MDKRDLVVIGASAGGVSALRELVSELPADFAATLLIVLHIGAHASILPELLASVSRLPVAHARGGELLSQGYIYVAPPDHHLLVTDGMLRISRGPKEHHARPAIDPLFRSAALARGPRVIGIVMSGRLDDGTAGLQAIKKYGGVAIVQDPVHAEQASMPRSALENVAVDHCLTPRLIGELLPRLVAEEYTARAVPLAATERTDEHAISLKEGDVMKELDVIGTRSMFVCPDCWGALWEIRGSRPPRYRCHIGHGFTLRTLEDAQHADTDGALWTAVRALEERERLLRALATAAQQGGDPDSALEHIEDADRLKGHVETLRALVVRESNSIRVSSSVRRTGRTGSFALMPQWADACSCGMPGRRLRAFGAVHVGCPAAHRANPWAAAASRANAAPPG